MKHGKIIFSIVALDALAFCSQRINAAQGDLSGTWVLDKDSVKGLASGIKTYTMLVKQDGQQLTIDTRFEGSGNASDGNANLVAVPGQTPKGAPTNGTVAGGSGYNAQGAMALRMVIGNATYSLDGKKTTDFIPGMGQATLAAKWAKSGKYLDLSAVHQENVNGMAINALTTKERWTLSADGQVLKVQRSVSTQQGSDVVDLTFRKSTAAP